MNIPPSKESANPHAGRAGLARLVNGHWLVYERVQATRGDEYGITHVALEGMPRTMCGKKPTLRYGVNPTDTISQIECEQCKSYLETRTL